eukprot:6233651-Prymnesium_polylepis.1
MRWCRSRRQTLASAANMAVVARGGGGWVVEAREAGPACPRGWARRVGARAHRKGSAWTCLSSRWPPGSVRRSAGRVPTLLRPLPGSH